MTHSLRGRGDASPAPRPGSAIAAALVALAVAVGCSAGPRTGNAGPGSPSRPETAPGGSGAPAPAAGSSPDDRPAGAGRIPLIVDSDLDADDIRALAYIAARPDVDLRAVTVAGTGIVHCPAGVSIARAVLARVGRGGVPVACGRSEPGVGGHAFPDAWRARADAAIGLDLSSAGTAAADPASAAELLATAVADAPAPARVVVLGPATNIADALAAHPDLAGGLASVTLMGGALRVRGNVAGPGWPEVSWAAEWNVFADPAAWQAVLDAGVHPLVVPIDATNAVPVSPAAFLALSANRDAPAAELVFDLFDADPSLLASDQSFWDSLTAVAVFDPGVITAGATHLRVELAPGEELGRVIEDPDGAAATVATNADRPRFEAAFISTLNGGAPVRTVPDPAVEINVAFDGANCHGRVPPTISTGYVSVAFDNAAATGAAGGLFLLADGVTVDDVLGAARTDPDRLGSLGRVVVGVNAEAGKAAREVGLATRPGNAFVACLTFDPDPRLTSAGAMTITP